MWPRTPEEHARGRNTGFVCFMSRDDAEEALNAYQETDPLRTGRRMWLRWGKNVKMSVKRGTGGVPIPPIRKKAVGGDGYGDDVDDAVTTLSQHDNDRSNQDRSIVDAIDSGSGSYNDRDQSHAISTDDNCNNGSKSIPTGTTSSRPSIELPKYIPEKHLTSSIKVIPPNDPKRLRFITTVASFVAKDGSILEKRLLERESNNPLFSFLLPIPNESKSSECINEKIFYRWRVFAFTQGCGVDLWRVDPFVMIEPNGRFWIPPPLDTAKALQEKLEKELKEENIRIQQERRRKVSGRQKDFMTGRQLENAKTSKRNNEGSIKLNRQDLEYWNDMIQNQLCASRDAICQAMSFCFDNSVSAQHISQLLKDSLMDDRKGISVETKISRLYLMSDILYNSQQPGVKNAFRYRDAIEAMAHDVFKCLGNSSAGRMTMNKLRNAVKAVLFAWAKWSVYNDRFLNELEALFEGKSLEEVEENEMEVNDDNESGNDDGLIDNKVDKSDVIHSHDENERISEYNSGLSTEKGAVEQVDTTPISVWLDKTEEHLTDNDGDDIDGEDLDADDILNELVEIDDDLDGESLHYSDFSQSEDEVSKISDGG